MDVAGLTVQQNLRLALADIASRGAAFSPAQIIERSDHLARWVIQDQGFVGRYEEVKSP